MQNYVWYAGYGSNLSRQRFYCYIKGGKPSFGNHCNSGCKNKTLPVDSKVKNINYPLYFALPNKKKKTSNWGYGGVAFIRTNKDAKNKTICRLWKITQEQYEEVKKQEGCWYNKEIKLGEKNSLPILTITNENHLNNIICPSNSYLKTICVGLKESCSFLTNSEITEYLVKKEGIKGEFHISEIKNVLNTIQVGSIYKLM